MTDLLRRVRTRRLGATTFALAIAFAGMLAPRPASAFCRTTTTPVPASYSPTRGCFTEGLPLYWKGACVGYSVNSAASANTPLATATTVIDSAFGTWNKVTCPSGGMVGISATNSGTASCSEVRYNPNGPNQNVIIFRDDRWPYSDPNNTLGLTTVTFNADNGEIYDADMEINATGHNLSTSDTVPQNGFDLLSVITHEAGHFLGLAHATDSKATMFASYKPGTNSLRSLTDDDIAGICDIFPNTTERNVDKTVSASGVLAADVCDPTPRHGFGPGCEENPAPADSTSGGGCAVASEGSAPTHSGLTVFVLGLAVAAVARRRKQRAQM